MKEIRDRYERVIDYMRISIIDRCNLRCIYCMPEGGIKPLDHSAILRYEEIIRIVRIAAELGVKKIRLTGGEPLIRRMIPAQPGDLSGRTDALAIGVNPQAGQQARVNFGACEKIPSSARLK